MRVVGVVGVVGVKKNKKKKKKKKNCSWRNNTKAVGVNPRC